jgi:hypothetical protein
MFIQTAIVTTNYNKKSNVYFSCAHNVYWLALFCYYLQRTVMEAVTAILGDELHVGILLQGKKVRDDSKTLIQTGISQDDKRHRLGFMLEPRHNRISSPYNEDPCFLTTSPLQKLSR